MTFIAVDGWTGLSEDQKAAWIETCTKAVVDVLGLPLDEVVIYLRDHDPGNWGQAGVTGRHPEWATRSRMR